MNEEIIKVLDELGKRFGIAIDWTSENVLPYLQDLMCRFIKYKTFTRNNVDNNLYSVINTWNCVNKKIIQMEKK